ncbi:MAG: immunoglobulin domain-containing protein, partial [Bacteroidota bacterium]
GTTFTAAPSFNHTLTVSSVGPFIGNAGGSPPAFTGLVDYFFNTASPISPEDPTVPVAPTITGQPTNQTVTEGQTATFSVTATGTPLPTYQWQKNNVDIAGATSASHTTPATTLGDNGATFRCVVSNSQGTVTSNAATLTVNPAPSSGIVSDDFSAAALNTSLWTFTNPGTPSTLSLVGTGTSDALLSIAVPGGSAHDVWTGSNNAPRIMQPANNTDLEIEVKFQSTMSAAFQMQGVIVQQDANNFLRFDFYHDGTSTHIFAASFVGGTATARNDAVITGGNPLWLRVKRQGNQWTESYSTDGTNFTAAVSFNHTLTVSSVGPFIGNVGGTPPAFTGLVDYFFNTASPIVPEDGLVAPTITTHPANQTVTVGQTATFSVTVSGTLPLSYQWQKNNVDIAGATSASHTTPATTLGDNGATFRCVVSNSQGTVTSNAATLTVNPAPSSGIVSDDFSAAALNTSLWTFTNPGTPSTLSLVGTGTSDALLSIAVPGGSAHDVWTGSNNAPRIMQPANNTDLEIEVKFQSTMSAAFQMQGVIVQQDANNFLRFDFYHDGTS